MRRWMAVPAALLLAGACVFTTAQQSQPPYKPTAAEWQAFRYGLERLTEDLASLRGRKVAEDAGRLRGIASGGPAGRRDRGTVR